MTPRNPVWDRPLDYVVATDFLFFIFFFQMDEVSALRQAESSCGHEADDEGVSTACNTTSDACALVPGVASANINKRSAECL